MNFKASIHRAAEKSVAFANFGASYDIFTAVGDVLITKCSFYVVAAFTSATTDSTLSIQTDDTTPTVFMTAAEGAEANLTVKTQMFPAAGQTTPFHLRSGQKIQYTVGTANQTAGLGKLFIEYIPVTNGYVI